MLSVQRVSIKSLIVSDNLIKTRCTLKINKCLNSHISSYYILKYFVCLYIYTHILAYTLGNAVWGHPNICTLPCLFDKLCHKSSSSITLLWKPVCKSAYIMRMWGQRHNRSFLSDVYLIRFSKYKPFPVANDISHIT